MLDIPGFMWIATGRPAGNVADMDNTGLEIELGYRQKFRKNEFLLMEM